MNKPAISINIAPGNNVSMGASLKNNYPSMNDIGSPKYSKGVTELGSTNR